ncbi:MAG: type I restriction endonuclease [Candidatus Manganitrophus sp.]|nr:type I restriction endonuclease [Candidatus Manganitrophus sp.]
MKPTDTSEKGLESLIMQYMTGTDGLSSAAAEHAAEAPAQPAGGSGWLAGDPATYDRAHALDPVPLIAFLQATQPEEFKKLGIANYKDTRDIARLKFFARLSNEIGKHGVIHVLRHGIKDGPLSFDLFYGAPSPGNKKAAQLFSANRFSVTRQLRYSMDKTRRALDLCLFINGLPIATFELKNSLTKQTAADAEEQYKRERDPREKLFEFKRCMVHLAVDDQEVRMCTELKGKGSWFLPFNQGWNDGAGNPAQSGRAEDRLSLEAHSHPERPHRHPSELRPGRRRRRTRRRGGRNRSRSSRAITSSTWCESFWPTWDSKAPGRNI